MFPIGQFVAVEENGEVVGSASTLIVTLNPEYAEHTWKGITSNGMFTDHNPNGDSLYGADISTRNLGMKVSGVCSMVQERSWPKVRPKKNDQRR